MKIRTLSRGVAALAVLALAAPAMAQVVANALPAPPPEGLPGVWNPAAPIMPTPGKWSATVSWQITNPVPGPSGAAGTIWTYWYKIDHTGGGPLSPPIQALKSSTLDLDPVWVYQMAGVYQFGQFEGGPGQSWAAETVLPTDSTLRWSHRAVAGLDTLTAGETIYLWVRSNYQPGNWVYLTLQDGTIAQTLVPAPSPIPEPATMALAGMGLAAIGGLRRRASR